MDDAGWSTEQMRLAHAAGIPGLRPAQVSGEVASGAVTTARRDGPLLSALWHRVTVARPDGAASLETHTFVRQRILTSRASPGEDDGAIVAQYLEREVRRALALRSLDVAEGETERSGAPIAQLTLERESRLPTAAVARLAIDGAARRASAVSVGLHSATWADVPELAVAAIVYARAWRQPPELVSVAA